MGHAVIYTRLSRDREEQTSTARQEADCRALAARMGLEVAEVYAEDPGTSGWDEDVARPAFDRMVAELGPGTVVIAWAWDRLSRRGIEDAGSLLRQLTAAGARLVTVTDGLDTSTDYAELPIAVRAIFAREESKKISLRQRSAKAHARARGRWLGGPPPFGLRVNPETKRLERDPEAYPHARRMVDLFLSGLGLVQVARMLNTEEVPSPRGGEWKVATIYRLLRSPAFAGLQGDGGVVYRHPETGEPVSLGEGAITPAERSTILRLLQDRSTSTASGRRTGGADPVTLLTGLGTCGRCLGALVRVGSGYACAAQRTGGRCEGVWGMAKTVDTIVGHRFASWMATLDIEDPRRAVIGERWLHVAAPEAMGERRALLDRLGAEERALADLEDARYLRGEFNDHGGPERYRRLRDALSRRIEGLREELGAISLPAVTGFVGTDDPELIRDRWRTSTLGERRDALRAAADRVVLLPMEAVGQGFGGRFRGERVVVEWAGAGMAWGSGGGPECRLNGVHVDPV